MESSVIITFRLNLLNSFFNAKSLSVSLIFNVCRPVKLHLIPRPKQVTQIVCAKSGFEVKSNENLLVLDSTFFKITRSSLYVVLTPNDF